jgi:hypothetical protein
VLYCGHWPGLDWQLHAVTLYLVNFGSLLVALQKPKAFHSIHSIPFQIGLPAMLPAFFCKQDVICLNDA